MVVTGLDEDATVDGVTVGVIAREDRPVHGCRPDPTVVGDAVVRVSGVVVRTVSVADPLANMAPSVAPPVVTVRRVLTAHAHLEVAATTVAAKADAETEVKGIAGEG